jgi:hypothetical protein
VNFLLNRHRSLNEVIETSIYKLFMLYLNNIFAITILKHRPCFVPVFVCDIFEDLPNLQEASKY